MKRIHPLLLAFVWSIIILVLSTIGIGVGLPPTWGDLLAWDKLAHAGIYGIFGLLLLFGFSRNLPIGQAILWSLLIGISYGIAMEWIQFSFFPDRYFEYFDILANVVGSLGSVLIFYFFIHKTQ